MILQTQFDLVKKYLTQPYNEDVVISLVLHEGCINILTELTQKQWNQMSLKNYAMLAQKCKSYILENHKRPSRIHKLILALNDTTMEGVASKIREIKGITSEDLGALYQIYNWDQTRIVWIAMPRKITEKDIIDMMTIYTSHDTHFLDSVRLLDNCPENTYERAIRQMMNEKSEDWQPVLCQRLPKVTEQDMEMLMNSWLLKTDNMFDMSADNIPAKYMIELLVQGRVTRQTCRTQAQHSYVYFNLYEAIKYRSLTQRDLEDNGMYGPKPTEKDKQLIQGLVDALSMVDGDSIHKLEVTKQYAKQLIAELEA